MLDSLIIITQMCIHQLTFGNMTFELNIFHLSNKHKLAEDDMLGYEEVFSIGPSAGNPKAHLLQAELVQKNEAIGGKLAASVIPVEPMFSPTPPSERKLKTKEVSRKVSAAHITAGVKELLLLNPP